MNCFKVSNQLFKARNYTCGLSNIKGLHVHVQMYPYVILTPDVLEKPRLQPVRERIFKFASLPESSNSISCPYMLMTSFECRLNFLFFIGEGGCWQWWCKCTWLLAQINMVVSPGLHTLITEISNLLAPSCYITELIVQPRAQFNMAFSPGLHTLITEIW